jgi:tRNA threonylcarbamoyladenosine biosynthesis protein TsaE
MSHEPIIPSLAAHGRLACDEGELVAWGERFGRVANAPLVVTLSGELGAGKTTLVRAICRGYGVTDDVTSPTFALVHRYDAPRSPVYHIDLYRLKNPTELGNLGWDEILAEHALVLIEWPERAGDQIPHDHVAISLQHLPDDPTRRLLYAGGHP